MKTNFRIFLFLVILIPACQKDDGTVLSKNRINTVEEACLSIHAADAAGKIVSFISTESDSYIFHFADQTESIEIARSIIREIEENKAEWKVIIHFVNTISCQLKLKGDRIGIEADSVKLDPFDKTPLAALASFTIPVPGQIRVVVPGKGIDGISIEHTFLRDTSLFEIPILGLYEDYENPVEFHLLDFSGNELAVDTIVIITASLGNLPGIVVEKNLLAPTESMVYMEVGLKQAYDQRGALRWLLKDSNIGRLYDRLPNGNWIANEVIGSVSYHWASFAEIDMLGRKVQTYDVPNLGHHEIRVIGAGESFLVNSNSVKMLPGGLSDTGTPQEDMVVEIDAATGEVVNTYDFNTILDVSRTPIIYAADDRFHLNSTDFDIGPDGIIGSPDDGVIVSSRHQCAVAKVNRNTGSLNWILAPTEEWPPELEAYLLTPIDQDGNMLDVSEINFWTYGQHSAIVLPNRNILIYDNGNSRGFYKGNELPENEYTRAVEYEIDEINRTIKKVWEFDYDQSIFNIATGEVDYLPESNGRLISYMSFNYFELKTPRVVEFDEQGTIIFEYKTTSNWDHYRSDKFNLYGDLK